jgi:hypothetical protein
VSLNWMIKRLVERVPSGVAIFALDACRENAEDSTFKSRGGPGTAGMKGLSAHIDTRPAGARRDRCVDTVSPSCLPQPQACACLSSCRCFALWVCVVSSLKIMVALAADPGTVAMEPTGTNGRMLFVAATACLSRTLLFPCLQTPVCCCHAPHARSKVKQWVLYGGLVGAPSRVGPL